MRRLVRAESGELYAVGQPAGQAANAGVWRYADGVWTRVTGNRFAADVAIDPFDDDR